MSDNALRVTDVTSPSLATMMGSMAPRTCMCTCGQGCCRCL